MGNLHDLSRPLHEQQPTTRFSDRVKDYVSYRPTYPSAAIDAIVEGLPKNLIAADIGAGTGISTILLAPRCHKLFAIEPNADMAAAAKPIEDVTWINAPAEATTLPDSCVDLVLAAQAFHWFKFEESLAEFRRILRSRGRLALMWNIRDPNDPVSAAYTRIIREQGNAHPAEMRDFDPHKVAATGLFGPHTEKQFTNLQHLDEAGFLGRAFSASYVPKEGPRAEQIRAGLREVHARYKRPDGAVSMGYLVKLFLFNRN